MLVILLNIILSLVAVGLTIILLLFVVIWLVDLYRILREKLK